jgi:hypothetical protein
MKLSTGTQNAISTTINDRDSNHYTRIERILLGDEECSVMHNIRMLLAMIEPCDFHKVNIEYVFSNL